MDVPDVRPDRFRDPDDRVGRVVHGRAQRVLPGARCANRCAVVEEQFGAVQMLSGPITYEVEGRQYVATIGGNVLMAYALRSRESLEPVDQEQLPGKKVVLSLK